MIITPCRGTEQEGWLRLRQALWPHAATERHLAEMAALLARGGVAFLAATGDDGAVGFAEAALRHDHVNGCPVSPVAFLEGVYVEPASRHQGAARRLVSAVCGWAAGLGSLYLASDAGLENIASHGMHAALGFAETERVVFFRKPLATVL